MYVNPFWLGVIVTICSEILATFIIVLLSMRKK